MDTIYRNRLPIQLRFNDVDVVGHVNNTVYFNFFDLGKTAYFDAVQGEHYDWKKMDIVVRAINAEFLAPTFYRDHIVVETAVVKIGNKSLTIEQRIIDADSGQEKCKCMTVMVGFDTDTNTAKEISPEWKKSIREYEQNPEL